MNAFAATAFAHYAECFAFMEGIGNTIDGIDF
jgi:hypothetical protein